MKLCKDCKFSRIPSYGAQFAKCAHPSVTEVSPVHGEVAEATRYCETERKEYTYLKTCGPDAKNFEPKSETPPDPGVERSLQNMRRTWPEWFPKITWKA